MIFLPLNIPPCGSGKLTAGIHVTITIVLYFGVKLQVLFDNNIGAVSIGTFSIESFSIEPICIPPDKLINCSYIQVYAYPGKACGILIMEVISYESKGIKLY